MGNILSYYRLIDLQMLSSSSRLFSISMPNSVFRVTHYQIHCEASVGVSEVAISTRVSHVSQHAPKTREKFFGEENLTCSLAFHQVFTWKTHKSQ